MTLLDPQTAYALWAESYPPSAHNALMEVEQEAMEEILDSLSASRALDVGTGTGRYLRLLAERDLEVAVGVDLSEAMLERAAAAALPLVRGDARTLPVRGGSFDLLVSSLMAGDVDDLSSWTGEASRVLRTGGSLLYSDFHPEWSARGWERTFEARGETRRVSYHPHSFDDHRTALEAAGFETLRIREPRFRGQPVCLVLHAIRA
jgi:malonyl-CoA O-methyltransferase